MTILWFGVLHSIRSHSCYTKDSKWFHINAEIRNELDFTIQLSLHVDSLFNNKNKIPFFSDANFGVWKLVRVCTQRQMKTNQPLGKKVPWSGVNHQIITITVANITGISGRNRFTCINPSLQSVIGASLDSSDEPLPQF